MKVIIDTRPNEKQTLSVLDADTGEEVAKDYLEYALSYEEKKLCDYFSKEDGCYICNMETFKKWKSIVLDFEAIMKGQQ